MADADFDEEEVWAVMKETNPKERKGGFGDSISSTTPRRSSSVSRMIPKSNGYGESGGGVQQSAPVNVPDWSKIYNMHEISGWGREEEEDDEEEEGRVPPHEWIAKKLARAQITSFSVCEGAGRTLKGRDLRKVRNAVLTKTGFLE